MPIRLNTEIFIERSRLVHGDKYDYSKSVFTTNRNSVIIGCPIHGDFTQNSANHMNGLGCRRCGNKLMAENNTKSLDKFIEDAKSTHGDLYDYSKVEYINNRTRVIINCKTHGDFIQFPSGHLKGHGCPSCGTDRTRTTTDEFIERSIMVHGNAYDYSKTKYVNAKTKVTITCPIHGDFEANPFNHMNGHKCYKCGLDVVISKSSHSQDDFIKMAKIVHGDKYDYSKTIYTKSKNKITIICPIHGEFEQKANAHLMGTECRKCGRETASSKTRYDLSKFIELAQITHGDKYGYAESVYVNSTRKIKIFCKQHGDYFYQSPTTHIGGNGCQKCATIHNTCIKSQWMERCSGRIAIFYIIKCFNDTESFYKYGITSKSVNERYPSNTALPYKYDLIREVKSDDLNYIWDLEKRFGRFKHKDKYSPLVKFSGSMNECFSNYTHRPLKKTE